MKRILTALTLGITALLWVVAGPLPVRANHLVYLPYAGQTWMALQIKTTQEQVWCLDSRAEAYPGFLTQLRDVNDQYTQRVGIKHRQVPFGDPSCQMLHVMLPDFPCGSGAAACIYYANQPVTIHYQETLGYTDWRSAQAHEAGHGILGQLHEQYLDSGGTIGCTGRQDTEMDCSSGVKAPQPLDIQRGCAMIATSWCGMAPAQTFPYWSGERWVFQDGWSWNPSGVGTWYDPLNRPTWGQCDKVNRDCWHLRFLVWMFEGTAYYDTDISQHVKPPLQ